jgi:hypothetical protein
MTWPLTPEEEFNPLLLPPVPTDYPRPLPEAEVPYVVGVPEMNPWYSDEWGGQGYAGPISPPPSPDVLPSFDRPLRNAWGKMPSEYQADYPQGFFPEVVDSYEAMFDRPPAATTQQRDWPGSDVRVEIDFAPRRAVPTRNLDGLGEWYSTTGGLVVLTLGAGALSFFGVRAFLRSDRGQALLRR